MSTFDASASSLGFAYQERQALLLAIQRADQAPSHELSVEKLDDVAIESKEGTTVWQVKNTGAPITDTSPDLWKTIRIWAQSISDGHLTTSGTMFILLAASQAGPNSAAWHLRDDSNRNSETARRILNAASSKSTNQELQPAFLAFHSLTSATQSELLANVFVADGSPDIHKVRSQIEYEVRWACDTNRRAAFLDRLEGWWHNVLITLLSRQTDKSLLLGEIANQIQTLRRELNEYNLPIDAGEAIPSEAEKQTFMGKRFVKQLEIIGLNHSLIHAMVDYYRAGLQRSRWIGDSLLYTGDLDKYDVRLQEEWQAQYDMMLDRIGEEAAESEMVRLGQELHLWMRDQSDARIVPECSAAFVRRGSYYKLSEYLKVGWHPQFASRLGQIAGAVK